MGKMDENGQLKIIGRKGDRIRRATETYYPAYFESFIAKHSSVAQVIVIGVPDQRLRLSIKTGKLLNNQTLISRSSMLPNSFLFRPEISNYFNTKREKQGNSGQADN